MYERTNGLTNEVLREGRKLGRNEQWMEPGKEGRQGPRQAGGHG